ncbi:MAG: aminomethyltransferase family protein, partial [Atopobiaceae bacterium]|nr:aminomethyltransferase family protein [Atopobiaceae bacterium]
GIPVHVARAGYTGEKFGYEIYVPAEEAKTLEGKLEDAAKAAGGMRVTEIDVMALTLPAEAGYYLMLDLRRCTPYEVGFDSMVDFKKDFVGKRALRKISRKEPERELVGIEVPDYDAVIYGGPDRKGNEVFKDGKVIGYVTKFTYGYTVEKNIGYALVKKGSVGLGDVVKVNNRYDAIITPKKHLA